MIRLGFGARLAIIFLTALVALQLVSVASFMQQRSRATESGLRLPLPDQAAALVELLETLPKEEWPKLLRATNSADLSVRIDPGPLTMEEAAWYEAPVIDLILRRYIARLGERKMRARIEPASELLDGPLKLLSWASPGSVEIEIELKSGERLSILAGGVLSLGIVGLPPGFWAGLLGVIIAAGALYLLRREAAPLRRLSDAVDRIDLEATSDKIPDAPRSAPEIRALVAAFNRLTERIATLIRTRMALVGGISHDLRTYVTRLRLRTDYIADEGERARAVRDLEEMSRLLDDSLLAFSAGSTSHLEELLLPIAVLKEEVMDRQRAGGDVLLSASAAAEAAEVLGDQIALRRLLGNLVENALRYGNVAKIRCDVAGDMLIIDIDDEGPGIPPHERALMLEPFTRQEGSRNRSTGGAGLGLSIARTMAERHGGTLSLEDAPGGGLRAHVVLPVFKPEV